jgi:branched-chain amino acid transport system permease protein
MELSAKWKALAGLIALSALAVLPFYLQERYSQYEVYLATKIVVWVLFAMSFNLVLGYGGMMSFGHAAFFGAAAYTCALLMVKAKWPSIPAYLIAPFVAALIGLIVGYFSVRITGAFYFATLTLSFSMLLYILVFKWRSFTFGDDGIQGIPVPELISTQESYINCYFFAIVVTLVCLYILWRIVNSPFGLILRTLREDPDRAAFIGVNVNRYRLVAFVISAFFSGIAGVLYMSLEASLAPDILFWSSSGEVILMGLVGGMHVFLGPAVGATIMVLLNSLLTSYTQHWGMFLGITLILIVLFFPEGVLGVLREKYLAAVKKRSA